MHLVAFVHGFDGDKTDFANFIHVLKQQIGQTNAGGFLLLPVDIGKYNTYHGIERCAVKAYKEITEHAMNAKRFSIIAHSLGGLIARYALLLLEHAGFFEDITPEWFVTFASPHLGVRRPQTTLFNVAFQTTAARLCKTTNELCLEDEGKILYRLTKPEYIAVLARFRKRILYSNLHGDFQVPYLTSAILVKNPYKEGVEGSVSTQSHHVYPHITKWSVEKNHAGQILLGVDEDGKKMLDAFKRHDSSAHLLKEMIFRLSNNLSWERYDVMFGTVFAHEQIINKRSLFPGRDVVLHFSSLFVASHLTDPAAVVVNNSTESSSSL